MWRSAECVVVDTPVSFVPLVEFLVVPYSAVDPDCVCSEDDEKSVVEDNNNLVVDDDIGSVVDFGIESVVVGNVTTAASMWMKTSVVACHISIPLLLIYRQLVNPNTQRDELLKQHCYNLITYCLNALE